MKFILVVLFIVSAAAQSLPFGSQCTYDSNCTSAACGFGYFFTTKVCCATQDKLISGQCEVLGQVNAPCSEDPIDRGNTCGSGICFDGGFCGGYYPYMNPVPCIDSTSHCPLPVGGFPIVPACAILTSPNYPHNQTYCCPNSNTQDCSSGSCCVGLPPGALCNADWQCTSLVCIFGASIDALGACY